MDLTSGAPFWIIKNGLLATYPRLKRDRRCDVAVIGGGITGALVAHRFAQAAFTSFWSKAARLDMAAPGRPPPSFNMRSTAIFRT
jgi:cation diffusion facilitator CzcD-associated flavoprotein CzcO